MTLLCTKTCNVYKKSTDIPKYVNQWIKKWNHLVKSVTVGSIVKDNWAIVGHDDGK